MSTSEKGKLTNDDHRWLREKLDEEDDGDGAFGRMVADYDSRSRGTGQARRAEATRQGIAWIVELTLRAGPGA
jgi:hypothetical protein